MMVQTLNPCSPASKTEEILSRYRPIAPKPDLHGNGDGASEDSRSTSQKIRHSPYLKNIWAHLQARPTRTRKRGRSTISAAALRRQRTAAPLMGLCCPSPLSSPAKCLSLQGFLSPPLTLEEESAGSGSRMITLPLLSSSPPSPPANSPAAIDLNTELEEKDLVLQLQSPTNPTTYPWVSNVIAPKPMRPIGSTIRVRSIRAESPELMAAAAVKMNPDAVEREVEASAFPMVISDSKNKVRMANSAYKELVGQPECIWLDNLMTATGKRISGEVMLQISGSEVPSKSKGFSCWVKIEWGSGRNKSSVDAFCDVVRLACERKDYLFSWRFHTAQPPPCMSNC